MSRSIYIAMGRGSGGVSTGASVTIVGIAVVAIVTHHRTRSAAGGIVTLKTPDIDTFSYALTVPNRSVSATNVAG